MLSCKFAACFQNAFSLEHHWTVVSVVSPKVNSSLTIRVHSLDRQLHAQEQYLNPTNFCVHLFLRAKKIVFGEYFFSRIASF